MKKYAVYASRKCTRVRKAILRYPKLRNAIVFFFTEDYNEEHKAFFENNGIKYYFFDFNSLDKSKDRNLILSDHLLDKLKAHNIDYCFTFGRHLLKGELLEAYNFRLVNIHPGILPDPDVVGMHAIDKAVAAKKRYMGNTVHFIDEGVDSGPIIMQNVMLAENFAENGYDAILDEQLPLLWETFCLLENDRIVVEGNHVRIKGADYTVSNIYPRSNKD